MPVHPARVKFMPSFRASVAIESTLPGVPAPAVLAAAREAIAAANCHVEDAFVDVEALSRGGLPRVTIRFVVPTSHDHAEDCQAWGAAEALAAAVTQIAVWGKLQVFRRIKGRWVMITPE
jgi:hypothetical protein